MTFPKGFGGTEKVDSTNLPSSLKTALNGLSKEQFNELKSMVAENKSPLKTKIKEATTIHHSFRVMFILGMITIIPMIAAVGWLATGELWVVLTFLVASGIMSLVIATAGKEQLDRWTREEDRNRNRRY